MKWRLKRDDAKSVIDDKVLVADGATWVELSEPLRWEPLVGEVIIGTFLGFAQKTGAFGPYRAVIMVVDDGRYTITGNQLVTMIEAGGIKTGDRLRIVYLGTGVTTTGFSYKRFQGYVARTQQRAVVA